MTKENGKQLSVVRQSFQVKNGKKWIWRSRAVSDYMRKLCDFIPPCWRVMEEFWVDLQKWNTVPEKRAWICGMQNCFNVETGGTRWWAWSLGAQPLWLGNGYDNDTALWLTALLLGPCSLSSNLSFATTNYVTLGRWPNLPVLRFLHLYMRINNY